MTTAIAKQHDDHDDDDDDGDDDDDYGYDDNDDDDDDDPGHDDDDCDQSSFLREVIIRGPCMSMPLHTLTVLTVYLLSLAAAAT